MMAFVAMAAGLAFASCQKEDNNSTANNSSNSGDNGGSQVATEWVDLGLPSGLLWAICNLGATSPEEYGDYYAWGETATKEVYSWSTYKYSNGGYDQLTKYCNYSGYGYNGFTDNLTTLEAMDDVAAQKLGSGARMPTADEWRELIGNISYEWTTMNGVNGLKFTASNGNSLFLPAAGNHFDSGLYGDGSLGYYRSSSLYADDPSEAWYFNFSESDQSMYGSRRSYGLSVRAVRSQN